MTTRIHLDEIDPRDLEMLRLMESILTRMGLDGLRVQVEAFQVEGRVKPETAAFVVRMATILDGGRSA